PGSTGRLNFTLSSPVRRKIFSPLPPPRETYARIAAACAIASQMSTPGMTGWSGKCPWKKSSFAVTFLIPTMRSPSTSTMRSIRRKGYRCGIRLAISLTSSMAFDSLFASLRFRIEAPLYVAHRVPQLRQARHQRHHLDPFLVRSCLQGARNDRSRRNGTRYSGLWTNLRAVANRYVIDHAGLSGEYHVVAYARAAGDARLRSDDRTLADNDVACDLHEIIDLRASSNNRLAERRAIDRAVGADFHVIANLDNTDLRDLDADLTRAGESKAVGADDYTCVKNDPVANAALLTHRHVWVHHAGSADGNSFA